MSRKIPPSPSHNPEPSASASSSTLRPTTPILKKRKSLNGKADVMTLEEKEKMFNTAKRLRVEAERLPVNEGALRVGRLRVGVMKG
jgi:hypothetical protein